MTVTTKKAFAVGLKRENFQVSVDKVPVEIVDFSNESSPVSVGILLDASGSMDGLRSNKGEKLRVLQQALAAFVSRSNKLNEYFVIGFSDRAELWSDWTSASPLLGDDIMRLKPFGGTKLHDACALGIRKLQQGRHSRQVLILVSDGMDNGSEIRFEALQKLVRETGVLFYSVYTAAGGSETALRLDGLAVLNEFVSASGGVLYETSNFKQQDVHQIFEAIANELRNQYSIAVEPLTTTKERKWHRIRVKVTSSTDATPEMKNLSARTREGYYSSPISRQN